MVNNVRITPGSAIIELSGSTGGNTIDLEAEADGTLRFYSGTGNLVRMLADGTVEIGLAAVKLTVGSNGLLSSSVATYESLVSADDDFITKKYFDDNQTAFNIDTLTTATIASGDLLAFADINDTNIEKKTTAANFITDLGILTTADEGPGNGLDADTVDGLQGADLVQTTRTLTAGTAISGGGTLAADRTFNLALEELSLDAGATLDPASDWLVFVDATDNTHYRITVDNLLADTSALLSSDIGSTVQAWDTDLDTYAANPLTSGELGQLQNIGTTTINATQWGYLGSADQGITTTDSVTFVGLTLSSNVTIYEAVNDGNPEIRLGATDAEEFHIQAVYDAAAQTLNYVLFQTDVASATADKGLFRFNVDGTNILDIDDGGITLSTGTFTGNLTGQADTVATITGLAPDTATTQATQPNITTAANLVTVGALDSGSITANFGNINIGSSTFDTTGAVSVGTLSGAGDVTIYEAVNDGSPEIRLGGADAEELHIQAVYDTGAQTLDYVLFQTDAASATANKGLFRFNVDGSDILDINDSGIDLDTGGALFIAGTSVLNATTLGTGVVTSSLTTVGALDAGSITSNFGNINIGASTFDTTGAVATGALTATGTIQTSTAGGGAIVDEAASTTNPTLIPDRAGTTTGIGGSETALSLIASGTEAMNITSTVVDMNDLQLVGYSAGVNAQTGTSYTLVASDNGKIITMSNASAITLTLENSLPAGFTCMVIQKGVGQITFTAEAGGSLNNRQSHTKSAGQYAFCTLYIDSNSGTNAAYWLGGDTAS